MSSKNFINELKWRGMLHDFMPGTEQLLTSGQVVKGYIGFDPTADSLGVGNMVQVMTLLHFQQCGHKPIALIGGATGMVGDPSGKSAERNLLDIDLLVHNQECQKKQLEKFLEFGSGPTSAELVNNYDWFKDFKFLDFIRDIGKHIPVNYMMAKDSVKNRLETGMSFTEFSYQLIQGYDFYWLNKNRGVQLQMGGSDQWGNITTGTELIRRKNAESTNNEAYALTTHLIKKADGTKFGKTESGNIWLDSARTSPYKFYQFWLNATDVDAENFIKIFTLFNENEITQLIEQHKLKPHERNLQKALAKDITCRVHSKSDFETAVEASQILFGNSTSEALKKLNENDFLSVFEGVPQVKLSKAELSDGINAIDFISEKSGFLKSKGEAKRAFEENSISINKEKADATMNIDFSNLINGKYILLQRGKKNYYLVVVE